jgi:hypothetical protein
MRKLQVFVSSTFNDLRGERQAAVAAVLGAGHIPAGMELFAAGDEEQLITIRRWIQASDIFMLIVGKRYGSVEPKTGRSYVDLEYEYAVSEGKPLFAVILSDGAANRKIASGELTAEDTYEMQHQAQYDRFLTTVRAKMCRFVDDTKDITIAVHESIRDLEQRHKFEGWVPGREVLEASAAMKQLAALAQENTQLREEMAKCAETAAAKAYAGHSFEEVYTLLVAERVDIGGGDVSLVAAVVATAPFLTVGVTNSASLSKTNRTLFHGVAAKLAMLDLAEFAKVPAGVHWQRLALNEAGRRFVTELKRRIAMRQPTKDPAALRQGSTSAPPAERSEQPASHESRVQEDSTQSRPIRSKRRASSRSVPNKAMQRARPKAPRR